MLNSPRTRFAASSRRPLILTVIGVFTVIVLGVGGYFGYGYYRDWSDTRAAVTEYINANVREYNETSGPSREIVEELNVLVEFDPEDKEDTAQRISSIRTKIEEITALNEEIDASREAIEDGGVEETKELASSFRNTLSTKRFTLESLSGFLEYQVCLIENATEQSTNLEDFTVEITNFSEAEGVSFEEKNKFIQAANTEIKANLQLLNDLPECFLDESSESEEELTSDYRRYYTADLRAVADRDRTLYTSYSTALDSLEQGLTGNSSEQVLRATNELVALSEQDITLFASDEIKAAITGPTADIQAQADILEREETALQNKLNTLKGKYFLESN